VLFASNRIKKNHSFHNILSAWSVFVLSTAPGQSPELGCHDAATELVMAIRGPAEKVLRALARCATCQLLQGPVGSRRTHTSWHGARSPVPTKQIRSVAAAPACPSGNFKNRHSSSLSEQACPMFTISCSFMWMRLPRKGRTCQRSIPWPRILARLQLRARLRLYLQTDQRWPVPLRRVT
jgi:hypothetical protein